MIIIWYKNALPYLGIVYKKKSMLKLLFQVNFYIETFLLWDSNKTTIALPYHFKCI